MCIIRIRLYSAFKSKVYRLWFNCMYAIRLLFNFSTSRNVILKISAFSNFLFFFFFKKISYNSAHVLKMVYKHNAIIISFPIVVNIPNSTNNAFVVNKGINNI